MEHITSREIDAMTDPEFVQAFESCRLPNERFHHRDHLRLAWIYLRRYGPRDASAQMRESIRRFAGHHGKPEKYHETVTLAWLHLVAYASERVSTASFQEVLEASPELLDKHSLHRYYSRDLLASEDARALFVRPDRNPLPGCSLEPTR